MMIWKPMRLIPVIVISLILAACASSPGATPIFQSQPTPTPSPTPAPPRAPLPPEFAFTASDTAPDGMAAQVDWIAPAPAPTCRIDDTSQEVRWEANFNPGEILPVPTSDQVGRWSYTVYGLYPEAVGTITYPDGSTWPLDLTNPADPDEPHCLDLAVLDVPGAPVGQYQIDITQDGITLTMRYQIEYAHEPRVDRVDGQPEVAWLAGFAPQEAVRVAVYTPADSAATFAGALDITTDRAGMALITNLPPDSAVFASGDASGEAGQITAMLEEVFRPIPATAPPPEVFVCPGALTARLWVGATGWVIPDGTGALIVRGLPGTDQYELGKLPEGTLFDVVDGPKCLEGRLWWLVYGENKVGGWISEGSNRYFVEPAP
jgi:hypothetical protein